MGKTLTILAVVILLLGCLGLRTTGGQNVKSTGSGKVVGRALQGITVAWNHHKAAAAATQRNLKWYSCDWKIKGDYESVWFGASPEAERKFGQCLGWNGVKSFNGTEIDDLRTMKVIKAVADR